MAVPGIIASTILPMVIEILRGQIEVFEDAGRQPGRVRNLGRLSFCNWALFEFSLDEEVNAIAALLADFLKNF